MWNDPNLNWSNELEEEKEALNCYKNYFQSYEEEG